MIKIIFPFWILFLYSCCQTKKEYYQSPTNEKNKIKYLYEVNIFTGKKCGTYLWLFETGDTLEFANFKNDMLNGQAKFYYESKQKQLEAAYIDDLPNGLMTEWYENGQLKYKAIYNTGKLWEIQIVCDSLGNKLDFGNFKEGNGLIRKFYPNGKILQEGKIKNGFKTDYWKIFTDTGILSDSILYKNGYNKYSDVQEYLY